MKILTVCSRIVVPFDGSELSRKALDTALTLLKRDDKMELDMLTVVNIRSIIHDYALRLVDIDRIREVHLTLAKEDLQVMRNGLSQVPNKMRMIVQEGDPASTICRFIEENQIDLVIMGSRGLSGIEELFLGSVSHHVVQKASCPVLVIK